MVVESLRPAAAGTAERGAQDARLSGEQAQHTSLGPVAENPSSILPLKVRTRDDLIREGHAVFTCLANKAPATPQGFKDAVSNREAAEVLWRRHPGPLTGIATGAPSGIAVLDVDPDGLDWLRQNARRLPPTKTVKTRRGGFHLWFKHKPGLRCSSGQIAPGVDVRADGGYVIAWEVAGFPVRRSGPLAPWPDWLTPQKGPGGKPGNPRADAPEPACTPTDRRLTGLVRVVAGAPEGQRNARLFWASCRMAGLIRGGLPKADGLYLLIEAAMIAGLDEDEARQTALSGLATGGVS